MNIHRTGLGLLLLCGGLLASCTSVPLTTNKDASTDIASFAQEMTQTHDSNLVARGSLRLPPEASNGNSRYIQTLFYCWELLAQDKLQLQIEWADISTPLRYTDAYIFERRDGKWHFSRHPDFEPFYYALDGYKFKRPCSH